MSNPIIIDSFQWGQANDKNRGQAWAFWNSKNIHYRKNSSYVELSKWAVTLFSITNASRPSAITFWGTAWAINTDIIVFTSGGIYTSAWQQSLVWDIVNVWEAYWVKYFVTSDKIYSYTTASLNTLLDTFGTTTEYRPLLNFFGDLIIGDGTKIARLNRGTTALLEWTAWATNLTIGWLDGTVMAITQIGINVYIWCDNGSNTNLYIWDGSSPNPTEKITYYDKSVRNVALLGNMHYWWQSKTNASIKEVLIGESYQPQVYVKSDYPELPLDSNPDDEKNKMAIAVDYNYHINAIETIWDIVFLPWIGRIFSFGRYFPWDKFSFNTEFSFTGTYVPCMASGWLTWSTLDAWWFLVFAVLNGSAYDIKAVNLWQDWSPTVPITYASSGEVESMEYIAESFADWEQDNKLIVPFELPTSDCSIKVYYKNDRATSYTLLKTITTTDYGTGYNVAEITEDYNGKWRTKQFKFELTTSNTLYTPKLYTWITNIQETLWKRV